jgi:hypothetical protein
MEMPTGALFAAQPWKRREKAGEHPGKPNIGVDSWLFKSSQY